MCATTMPPQMWGRRGAAAGAEGHYGWGMGLLLTWGGWESGPVHSGSVSQQFQAMGMRNDILVVCGGRTAAAYPPPKEGLMDQPVHDARQEAPRPVEFILLLVHFLHKITVLRTESPEVLTMCHSLHYCQPV